MKKVITLITTIFVIALMTTDVLAQWPPIGHPVFGEGGEGGEGGNATIEEGAVNNENTNTNTNTNQSSSTGIGFSNANNEGNTQEQSANNEGNTQEQSVNFEASETKRDMPNAVLPGFPNLPSYFNKTLMTHEYMGIEKLIEMKSEWSEFNIKTFTNRVKDDVKKVNLKSYSMHLYKDKPEKLKVTFVKPEPSTQPKEGSAFMGTLVATAEGDGVPTEAVFAAIAKKAFERGANVIYPMNQGAKRVLSASSMGIALGYTHVVMGGGSESSAGAGTVGVGVSKGESSYRHEPFVRVALFRAQQKTYDNLKIFPNGVENDESLQDRVRELQEKVRQYQQQNN